MLRESSPVSFKFAGGIETKATPASVPTTKLLVLENGVFTKAISIQKRNGYADRGQEIDGSVATVDGAIRMAARADELLEFTPNRCYSRQTVASQWSDAGAVYSAVGADRPLVVTGTDQTMPDHAELDGVTLAAWEDSAGGVWWSTLDATSGRVYRAKTQADALGRSPRCVAVGGNLHAYYAVPSQRTVMVLVINPAEPSSAVTPSVLVNDLDSTDAIYDTCATARTGTPSAIAWLEFGTLSIRVGYVDSSGVLGAPLLGHPSVLTYAAARAVGSPLAVMFGTLDDSHQDRIVVAYVAATLNGTVVPFAGGSVTAAVPIASLGTFVAYASTSVTRVTAALAIDDDGTQIVTMAWEESAVAASNRFVATMALTLNDASLTATTTLRSVGLVSRAFAIDDEVFAVFAHDTTFFNTYLTFRISGGGFVPVGRHVPAEACGAPTRHHLSSVHVTGSVAAVALPVKQRLISENDDKFTEQGLRLITMDFDNAASHQAVQFGRGLYMAGACPMHYDGRIWTELGFHVGPELIATVTAAGGSMTSSTTYEYKAWYEWTDAQGEIHRGPVSAGTLVTMGGSDTQVTLTLPTLRVTLKPGVRIMVARSLAALTGDTAEFRRVTSLDSTTSGSANGYVANDTSIDTVSFLDRMSDTTLRTFDEIYTDNGIFSNDPTALGSAIWRGKDRLFSSDPSDGRIVHYSQPLVDGYGVEWPPDLFLAVDLQSGSVTAGAALDERVVVWTERGIYTFAGGGPAQDGSTDQLGSGFSEVQTIPSDVGCTDPASIVLTPNGFLFKTAKGIYGLGNDMSVAYVGAPVEIYNAQTVRRATVLPDRTQVVFLTDSGSTLLYDYLFGQWSTFTNHEGFDAAVVSGQYHYLRTDGRVFRETIGEFSDAGVRIRLRLETAWIHMLEYLQGFQKFFNVHLLGTWLSAHQLGVQYQTDYTHGWTDAVWFDATGLSSSAGWITGTGANTIGVESIAGTEYSSGEYGSGEYGGTSLGEYAWRLDLYEVGQSIQLRFEDFEASGFAGASFELTELVVTGGVLGTVRRPMTAGRSA